MKVKVISRNPDEYIRETKNDNHKIPRNYDPDLHPFEAAREYVRALNATKLDRVFAKPFVGSLDGHRDSIASISKHPKRLSVLLSGAYDGEVRVWDLPQRRCVREFVAHDGPVKGVVYTSDGERFITIGNDKTIKTWSSTAPQFGEQEEPVNTIISKSVVSGISYNRSQPRFATCGEICQLWEDDRNEPVRTFQWGVDSLHDVAFNPIEVNLLAACASDRSVILYDTRDTGPLRKVVMKLQVNKICWNPMEAFSFTCASEDFNLYTFDTRQLRRPMNVHMDHIAAVTSIDYAPTGKEFVTGSYDKSIRIFECGKGHSREIYHTKRMQRLTCVQWTLDNKFILSGSDEMNIRIWKARASEKLGALRPREKTSLNYAGALREKYATHPQIRRISRHRNVPQHIYNAQGEMRTMRDKSKRKESNRRRHSKRGQVPHTAERNKHVLREDV